MEGPGRYTTAFAIMIVLLVIAFVCNELIRPVDSRHHEPEPDALAAGDREDAATKGAQS